MGAPSHSYVGSTSVLPDKLVLCVLGKYYLTSLLHEDDQRMLRLQCRLVGSWRHGLLDGYWKGALFILPI